jgi:hypothetical protein
VPFDGAKAEVFARNLDRPYGIAFVQPAEPRYVYVAAANQVIGYRSLSSR